ncbi:hypothetical protein [Streptomyces sp. NPDC059783]|uniref:hypothetical protein n=1 Tax=Streptomyces sp. NPDC059783 TaxID=3346944 RepID=UPI003659C940
MTPIRRHHHAPRPAHWGAALLALALATGCSGSHPAAAPSPSRTASASAAPSETPDGAADAPVDEASPEPSPVISREGRTKIVTLGNTEVRVTHGPLGFSLACNVTNTWDRTLNFTVTVSVGDGEEWVRTTECGLPKVAAGRTGKVTTTVADDSYGGASPDDPKVYIDSVIEY